MDQLTETTSRTTIKALKSSSQDMVFQAYLYQIMDPNTRLMSFDSLHINGNLNTLHHPQNIPRTMVRQKVLSRSVGRY